MSSYSNKIIDYVVVIQVEEEYMIEEKKNILPLGQRASSSEGREKCTRSAPGVSIG